MSLKVLTVTGHKWGLTLYLEFTVLEYSTLIQLVMETFIYHGDINMSLKGLDYNRS